jgi:hypothetical protein
MRITSAGEVLVGGTTAIQSGIGLTIQNSAVAANTPASLNLFRNDTSILSGNELGNISFYGNDTTSNTPTAHATIAAVASGEHAAGDNPTDLVFRTTPDGSATVAEVARFTESKYLRFASGTGGIQFGGDTAAANALDDYEEGTWTPALKFGGASVSLTSASGYPVGRYTKIGNIVTAFFEIRLTNKGTSTGSMTIEGLPFTSNSAINYGGYITRFANSASGDPWTRAQYVKIDSNTTVVSLGYSDNSGNVIQHTQASVNNSGIIVGEVIYQV